MRLVVSFRVLLTHCVLALSLSAGLAAIAFGSVALGVSTTGLLPGIVALFVCAPLAVAIASRLGRLSQAGSLFSTLAAALVLWLWLLSGLRNVAIPVAPDTTMWQVALHNGPVPLLQLWGALWVSVALSLLALRRFGAAEKRPAGA
jgi:hypothetical protein